MELDIFHHKDTPAFIPSDPDQMHSLGQLFERFESDTLYKQRIVEVDGHAFQHEDLVRMVAC